MHRQPKSIHPASQKRGFSLIEMLVVIAIAVVLLGIVAAVSSKAKAKKDEQQTVVLLQNAISISDNYFSETEKKINHKTGATGCPVISGSGATAQEQAANAFIERFVWSVNRLPATAKIITNLKGTNSIRDTDGDGFDEIVDAWGHAIAYVQAVKSPDDPVDFTTDDFLPTYPQPYFASAGADGNWGDASSQPAAVGTVREDNLYSFENNGRSKR